MSPRLGLGLGFSNFHNSNEKKMIDKYLFIDGAYFERIIAKVSDEFFNLKESAKLNYQAVIGGHKKAFYYHCLPGQRDQESDVDFNKRKQTKIDFFNQLKLIDKLHVFEGLISGSGGKNVRQKGVDIMIAVDMMKHSFRKNMDEATLLAGDLDFKPLLDALVAEGMFVNLQYSNLSISNELLYSADKRERITIRKIYNWIDLLYRGNLDLKIPVSRPYPVKSYSQGKKLISKDLLNDALFEVYFNNDSQEFEAYYYDKNLHFKNHCYNDLDKLIMFIEDDEGEKVRSLL
ncbi:NYN domain-containing protein [Saccharicrinis sp. FJH62]|uniref:NYN domain-containing protein n=1 Tax=Saccharicrinis sp. FJH62 TaxID=3344657 RepID=UPI0035D4B6C1